MTLRTLKVPVGLQLVSGVRNGDSACVIYRGGEEVFD